MLTSAQGNYTTIELECLAIQYALSKSEFYLRGLFYGLDRSQATGRNLQQSPTHTQQPAADLHQGETTGLQFHSHMGAGKDIADALSRYPVFGPHEMELPNDNIATCFRVNKLMNARRHHLLGRRRICRSCSLVGSYCTNANPIPLRRDASVRTTVAQAGLKGCTILVDNKTSFDFLNSSSCVGVILGAEKLSHV